MKKIITVVIMAAFVLGNVPLATAFKADVALILEAEADLKTAVPELATMPTPQLKNTLTGENVAGTKITWTYTAGKTWKIADQYLEISYEANLPGWGIQLYTANMGPNANPQWQEKPVDRDNLRVDKPAGLIGETGKADFIAIPIAWKAFPGGTDGEPVYKGADAGFVFGPTTDYKKYYKEPIEVAKGDPAKDNYYIELYQLASGLGTDDEALYGKYCWLKDKGSQKWNDANDNRKVDAGEIISDFSNGNDYITVVNYLGSSTCTSDSSGTFIYRDTTAGPIYLVLAAKIAVGTIRATYSTNTLTLELYQE